MLATIILVVVAAVLMAPGTQAAEDVYVLWGNPKAGREVFVKKGCSSCHRIRGEELAQWQRYASPVLWAEVMWRHGPEMQEQMAKLGQAWPRFTGTEMADLVAYFRSVIRKAP